MKKAKKRGIIAICIAAALMLLLILHITLNVNPIIEQVSEKEVRALAERAVNSACDEVLSEYFTTDMVDYVIDDSGNVQLITANTVLMNTISRKAIEFSQSKIEALGQEGVPIPLGSLSGMTILSGQGPDVYIKVFPIGSITADFVSEFVTAGINQTRHKISLIVSADIRVVMPGLDNVVNTNTQILMCENIIVGKVPSAYFNTHEMSDILDLVP